MLAVLTGIPGTGKTTVAKKALEKLSADGVKYELITYGSVMVDMAIGKQLVDCRDEMRKLSPDQQREIQQAAAEEISRMAAESNVLLDTHCTISTSRGYLPGLPEKILGKLNPDLIILVEADPSEISARRQSDTSRDRDDETEEAIAMHQDFNRNFASAYCTLTGATVKVVRNPQDGVDKAAYELVLTLK